MTVFRRVVVLMRLSALFKWVTGAMNCNKENNLKIFCCLLAFWPVKENRDTSEKKKIPIIRVGLPTSYWLAGFFSWIVRLLIATEIIWRNHGKWSQWISTYIPAFPTVSLQFFNPCWQGLNSHRVVAKESPIPFWWCSKGLQETAKQRSWQRCGTPVGCRFCWRDCLDGENSA